MTASLAFRKNEAAIIAGDVPEKFQRLLPHIPGNRILEIGSAEGVLALLMARRDGGNKRSVIALERSEQRVDAAMALHKEWNSRFSFAGGGWIEFVCGDIRDNLGLLDGAGEGVDTLVAVRMVYYLRDDLDKVFAEVAKHVPNVVLCGNRNRADRYRAGAKDEPGGPHNYYASLEGMKALLERHAYTIVSEVTEGDEIVVGRKEA